MLTVILVRHGERPPGFNPSLLPAGQQRAELLRRMLEHWGITAIYSTEFLRTQQTAGPLAQQLGIVLFKFDTTLVNHEDKVVADIRARPNGSRVLVVGHDDTVPKIVNLLVGSGFPPIPSSEFDNLYICSVLGNGQGTAVHLKYGNPSSP